jgi:hypothetical protein
VSGLQKENVQKKTVVETASTLDAKREFIFDKLSELMDQTSGNYGPLLMKELQRRLEFVVQNFNDELKALIKSSFEEWAIKDSQLRDLIASNLPIQKNPPKKENQTKNSSRPGFIKDVEFGPLRSK